MEARIPDICNEFATLVSISRRTIPLFMNANFLISDLLAFFERLHKRTKKNTVRVVLRRWYLEVRRVVWLTLEIDITGSFPTHPEPWQDWSPKGWVDTQHIRCFETVREITVTHSCSAHCTLGCWQVHAELKATERRVSYLRWECMGLETHPPRIEEQTLPRLFTGIRSTVRWIPNALNYFNRSQSLISSRNWSWARH